MQTSTQICRTLWEETNVCKFVTFTIRYYSSTFVDISQKNQICEKSTNIFLANGNTADSSAAGCGSTAARPAARAGDVARAAAGRPERPSAFSDSHDIRVQLRIYFEVVQVHYVRYEFTGLEFFFVWVGGEGQSLLEYS